MIRRGEIYFVNLNPVRGREQAGRRPVLVVSSDSINRQNLVISVIAGTDGRNVKNDYSTNIRLLAKETGLQRDTVFLGFQVRSLDPSRFLAPSGRSAAPAARIPPWRLGDLDSAIRASLGLD